jgi:hypothetical protein
VKAYDATDELSNDSSNICDQACFEHVFSVLSVRFARLISISITCCQVPLNSEATLVKLLPNLYPYTPSTTPPRPDIDDREAAKKLLKGASY